jgi:hypothetical protein
MYGNSAQISPSRLIRFACESTAIALQFPSPGSAITECSYHHSSVSPNPLIANKGLFSCTSYIPSDFCSHCRIFQPIPTPTRLLSHFVPDRPIMSRAERSGSGSQPIKHKTQRVAVASPGIFVIIAASIFRFQLSF